VWGRTVFFWVERRLGGAFGWDACGGAAGGVGHAGGGARSVAGPWLGLCWAPACRQRGPRLHATCAASAAGRAGVCDWESWHLRLEELASATGRELASAAGRAGVCGWESCFAALPTNTGQGGGARADRGPATHHPARHPHASVASGPGVYKKPIHSKQRKETKQPTRSCVQGPAASRTARPVTATRKKTKGRRRKKTGASDATAA